MSSLKPHVQHVAIETENGVAVMQFVTRQEYRDGTVIECEATDDAIASEIKRTGLNSRQWARVSPADLPSERECRAAWRLVNGRVVVIPSERSNVIEMQPSEAVEDPLPRMFRSSVSPDVAPEMLERAADFEQRAIAVVDAARQSIEDSRSDRARIDDLETTIGRVSERLDALVDIVVTAAQRDGGGR